MKTSSKTILLPLCFLLTFFVFNSLIFAQQSVATPDEQELEQLQNAYKSGIIDQEELTRRLIILKQSNRDPGALEEIEKKFVPGSLSPEEVAEGREMLEKLKEQKDGDDEPEDLNALSETELKMRARDAGIDGWYKVSKTELIDALENVEALKSQYEQAKLEIFGHNLFDNSSGNFVPIESIPVSNDYIVGPGDEIKIIAWGRMDATYVLEIDREGIINFPEIGPMNVVGMTFAELKAFIKKKAEAITGVNVSVSMGALRSVQVFVLGEVTDPGLYTVSSLATVVNALLSSGGPTELGSLRNIQLKRQGNVVSTIDLYDFLLKGDTTSDVRLISGDVIFVPQTDAMVKMTGNVKRPAIYEIKGQYSLPDALEMAGGLSPDAYNQRIQINRSSQNKEQIVLDIAYAELKDKKDVYLKDGDHVRVFPIHDSTVNAIYLYGNVIRPGEYAFVPDIRLLDILPDFKSLDKDTYLDYALVKRYRNERMEAELIPFDLGELLQNRDESQNIVLMPEDEIYVFNKGVFTDKPIVSVEGEIRNPGSYFVAEDMRLKDLFFKAGFFTKNAYLKFGHLYRTDKDTNEKKIFLFNIEKALSGNLQHNLKLENHDKVVVHSVFEYNKDHHVTILGDVNNPGEYPFANNMSVRDLILIAGNLDETAYYGEAELVRYDIADGEKFETSIVQFDLKKAMDDVSEHNLKLRAFDVVTIKQISDWNKKNLAVKITGEVVHPGTYHIQNGERLSSIIERAGGFTDKAYLRGAIFTRESSKAVQKQRINEMLQRLELDSARLSSEQSQALLSPEDATALELFISSQEALIKKLRSVEPTGRVIVSLSPLSVFSGNVSDLVLEDSDTLHVPSKPGTVNVLGAVYNPTSIIYDEKKSELKYYLAQTGGPTDNANEKFIYIVSADGTVISKAGKNGVSWSDEEKRFGFWGSFENAKLYPGDTVLVPEKIIKPDALKNVKDVTEILYQIAVIAGITIQQVF
ncbi:MAG: SLBB domain-containing protein [Desulfobacterales bacterium]|nr:SLBB domain-containing protein [Desulfobacterales bacterium]